MLKDGKFNGIFGKIYVTNGAHSDILLQAKHLENITEPLTLIPTDSYKEQDQIYRTRTEARIQFIHSDVSAILNAVPTSYQRYKVTYKKPATATVENVDAILQWKSAKHLEVEDDGGVLAPSISQRIGELSKELEYLQLSFDEKTYDQINVAEFFDSLPAVRYIGFVGKVNVQIAEFFSKVVLPPRFEFHQNSFSVSFSKKADWKP